MKHLNSMAYAIGACVLLSSCAGLGTMVKKANTVTYEVSPKPLEVHGDSVAVSINGKYPAKYFPKKATLVATPVIKSDDGSAETALKAANVQGEGVEGGSGQKVGYKTGGSFSHTDKVPYKPEMKLSDLNLKATATMKSKTKDLPVVKLADGVITTSLLVQKDEMPTLAKDNYTGPALVSQKATILFLVNQAQVRTTEVKSLTDTIKSFAKKGLTFKGVSVNGYASPDGEMSKNDNLSKQRAEAARKFIMAELVKSKMEGAKNDSLYSVNSNGEDWDGFKAVLSASSIGDKDNILSVANSSADAEAKEKDIRKMDSYKDVSKEVMPKLRRAEVTITVQEKPKTNEQIKALSTTYPDSLSAEELLFATTMTDDLNTKLQIYKAYTARFADDWRGHNNIGYVLLKQGNDAEANAHLEKANQLSPNNPVVLNNLGIVSRWNGNRDKAAEYYQNATAAGKEVSYNQGVLEVMKGNYSEALSKMGDACTFNAALANVLAGKPQDASSVIECSEAKTTGMGYYLKAIIGARTNNPEAVITNLRKAVEADASLKGKAKEDLEFMKWFDNADFKAIVG